MAAPVKLTVSEGVALAMELADAVGHDQLLTVLTATLGVQRALALAEDHTGRISKAERAAALEAIETAAKNGKPNERLYAIEAWIRSHR